jgi:sulfate transport system permease protein
MSARKRSAVIAEPLWLQRALIALALILLAGLVGLPLVEVFRHAFSRGIAAYFAALTSPETKSALRLTLLVSAIAVPLNTIFGVAAAWLVTRYRFFGRTLIVSLIDLPFAVSPVIAGMLFVLLFGAEGLFGAWLVAHDISILYAVPGIALATTFVTFPFVARELMPTLEQSGASEEEAALTLGASGWTMFFRVTLPKIKWALLYGVILTNARAMGEFGAVSVVSGHISGKTNTLPLHAEALYNENNLTGAFAVASLLTLLAVATIAGKKLVELRRGRKQGRAS